MRHIAVIGVPNAGKTTLYNYLTGSRFKTVNYPGSTVECSVGRGVSAEEVFFVDTPGIYSLIPKSADEEVTNRVLLEGFRGQAITGAIVLVDGTQLARQLPVVLQLQRTGIPMVVAVTMADLLAQQGVRLDTTMLSATLGAPVLLFNGANGDGEEDLSKAAQALPFKSIAHPPGPIGEDDIRTAARMAEKALQATPNPAQKLHAIRARTQAMDRFLLHPVLGPALFLGVMFLLFSSIYWLAAPFMDFIDETFGTWADAVAGATGPGLLGDFLSQGVVTGVGAVMVFVPQIFILFIGIGALEATGYFSRAAAIVDRFFTGIGLSGRSFVPLLSGFSCAIPAMISARNISSKRDRWITTFIIPLMTCSARLPVYALLLGFLFVDASPWIAGAVLALLYLGSLVVGGLAAGILNRILPQDKSSFLLMELPLYRRPHGRVVLRQALFRTWDYVRRAGPTIFVISVVLWTASTFPNYEAPPAERLQTSYAGQAGHVFEPLFRPMGADWRVGVGLISAFAAREVFVSALALTFNIAGEEADSMTGGVLAAMKDATFADGQKVFTVASVIALMVFFMIAMQCMATFAVARKESASMKFALTQLAAFNAVAYGLAVLIYQSLTALGF